MRGTNEKHCRDDDRPALYEGEGMQTRTVDVERNRLQPRYQPLPDCTVPGALFAHETHFKLSK